jgi:DNA-binding winged helix-turn-helix (wHTH) protein/class 3 adenylate cyclase/tetratricopeptide (TPR) repeat protein
VVLYTFGDYTLDTRQRELRCADTPVKLEPRVFDVLVYLVQHREQVVSKQELFDHLWSDQYVGDAALERCIRSARQAIGDNGRAQHLIKTLHRRGYRFVAAVQEHEVEEPTGPVLPPPDRELPPEEEPAPAPDAGVKCCVECQHINTATAAYCVSCGARLVQDCSGCGQTVHLPAAFCPACGARLGGEPDAPSAELIDRLPPVSEGERKQVTVLCCTMTGEMTRAEHFGIEAMRRVTQAFLALAQQEVERYEGTLQPFEDNGVMALFGAPIAHEDHAQRAVLAALSIQRRLRKDPASLGVPHGDQLAVRIGLHSGLMVVGASIVTGETTHLADRLQYLAKPGMVLASEATLRLIQGHMQVETSEPVHVIGQPEPVTVYTISGTGEQHAPAGGRGERALSRFVGRQRELAMLHELLTQVEEGRGQVVGIVGEAGMGKSRLVCEFRRSLQDKPLTYLEGHCPSYGRSIPYLPVLDLIRTNCSILDTDGPETIVDKVRSRFEEIGREPDIEAPYLFHLLGLPVGAERLSMLTPEAIKVRTFETLRQVSLHASRQRPLIIIVEDLHWMDTTSEALFASLVEGLVGGAPILLLTTYRPGYHPPWSDKSFATQIALHRLARQDSLSVVRSTRPQKQLPDALTKTILDRAEGNPFFLEELTHVISEDSDSEADIAIPDTIQGVLMARVDRLSEVAKRVLQTASVLGQQVSARLLEMVWEEADELAPCLQELKRLEFLYERVEAEESVYVFKHALTREVVYESLLPIHRQTLHAKAGQGLESRYANRLEEVYDRLAYHYAKTDETIKAVTYLSHLARQAAQKCAHAEAVATLNEMLGHIEKLSDEEQSRYLPDVGLRLVDSLHYLGRFQESLELLQRQQARFEAHQDTSLAGHYALQLGFTYSMLGDHERAAQHTQRALQIATQDRNNTVMGKSHYVLALEGYWLGRPCEGIEHSQQAIDLLERTGGRLSLGMAYFYLGVNHTLIGDFVEALNATARARAHGEVIGDPSLQSYVAWLTGLIQVMQGEWEQSLVTCQQCVERAPHPLLTALASSTMGYAYVEQGQPAQALSILEQAVEHMRQFQHRPLQGWVTTLLGEAYRLDGHLDKAREMAEQGLAITREVDYRPGVGIGQRALGRIAQASDDLVESEQHFNDALETFATMPARYELGRTRLDLATIAHAQGNLKSVTTHLSEAHRLFSASRVSAYIEHTEQLANGLGVALSI